MSTISSKTNVKDRVFVIQNKKIWERRYQNNSWNWIAHQALNNQLAQLDLQALGPCLVNTSENVARLYIQTSPTKTVNQTDQTTRWMIYNFNPNQTDYSDFSNFQIGNYTPITNKWVSLVSNISVSDDWKLYGMSSKILLDYGVERVALMRFDLDLEVITQSDFEIDPFKIAEDPIPDGTFIARQDAKFARPSIMSNHDVFFGTGEFLHHANINMGISAHTSRIFYDISDPFDDSVFVLRNNGKLYARRFDVPQHKWVWDEHGRPIAGRHFNHRYRVGSLRRMNKGVLMIIAPKWKDDKCYRVYHRWQDEEGGWHWADHGYPSGEDVTEIGPAYDDKFFIKVASGKLYERHWNPHVQRWAWEDHGVN